MLISVALGSTCVCILISSTDFLMLHILQHKYRVILPTKTWIEVTKNHLTFLSLSKYEWWSPRFLFTLLTYRPYSRCGALYVDHLVTYLNLSKNNQSIGLLVLSHQVKQIMVPSIKARHQAELVNIGDSNQSNLNRTTMVGMKTDRLPCENFSYWSSRSAHFFQTRFSSF